MSPAEPGLDQANVRIERLALRVTGLDVAAARTLARLVAEGLGPDVVGSAGPGVGRLRIQVTADAADQGRPDRLARRIVGEVGRALGEAAR